MYIRVPVRVMVSMKSAASSASACETQELSPGHSSSVWSGVDPGLAQDLPDRGRGDLDTEGEQFPVHQPVAPR
jgi:hypothetical protein